MLHTLEIYIVIQNLHCILCSAVVAATSHTCWWSY